MSSSELQSDSLLAYIAERNVRPELFLDGNEIDRIEDKNISLIGDKLTTFGLVPITLHAPFEDLSPGSSDETIRDISYKKILRAVRIAKRIPIKGVVVHSGYSDWHFDFNVNRWLERAVPFFSDLCEEALSLNTRIFAENIFEKEPSSLLSLSEKVGAENFGFCFDPGHSSLFSEVPPEAWIATMGEQIGELHLHDNSGMRDEHLPLLEGTINFRAILSAVKELGIKPILTLEPHTFDHAKRTLANLIKVIVEIYGEPLREVY